MLAGDIPEEYAIGDEGLRHIGYRSAGTLRRRTPSVLLQHCGGKHNKQELDFVRKGVVRKYVCYFYLEVVKEDSWNVTR